MNELYSEVVITADDANWLVAFTRTLIEERLAAAAHNVTAIRSVYRWNGKIEDRLEARAMLHTRTSLVPMIIAKTREKHSYQVPGIVALPILDGNPDYLAWIDQETRELDSL
jgi:periplasmic divalent cation tolerance protein